MTSINLSWITAALVALPLLCLTSACGAMLRGVTMRGNTTEIRRDDIPDRRIFVERIQRRKTPLVFSNPVPKAKSREIVDSGGAIIHLIPAIFGGLLGTRNYNIEDDAADRIAALQPEKAGNILIADNIKLDMTAGFGSEFWNNYVGALLITYEGYGSVYEIAEISPDDLYDYVYGVKKEQEAPATDTADVKPFAVFRGVVHSVSGSSLEIFSPKTSFAHPGQTIVILNRNGKVAGKARVNLTFHTKVTATMISGTAAKGFSAEIY